MASDAKHASPWFPHHFYLRHIFLTMWCAACVLGTVKYGPWAFLSLGMALIVFATWPPIRFMRGGRLGEGRPFRWKRRAYRLSDWRAIAMRMRFAIPAWAVLALLLCETPPSEPATLCVVIGWGVWALWLSMSFTSQRGELDWRSLPLQALPFGLLLACFLFAVAPQETVDWTGISVKRISTSAGGSVRTGISVYGLRFGRLDMAKVLEQELFPRPHVEDEQPESLREILIREQRRAQWLERREREEGE